MLEERGWYILNGTKNGDEEGEYTYIRRNAATVIDYVIVKDRKMRIETRVESDHQPIGVCLKSRIEKEKRKDREEVIEKEVWTEKARKEYIDKTENLEYEKEELTKVWEELKKKVKKARKVKTIKVKRGKVKGWRKLWWDKDCKRKKKKVKKAYKDWKKEKIDRLRFVETRKELRGMCREKEEKKQKEVEEEIKNIKKEGEAWKIINRMRKKKEGISEKIERREWRDYFKEMFNESDEKKMDNWERIIREEEKEDLRDEEIKEQMKKLNEGKAGSAMG